MPIKAQTTTGANVTDDTRSDRKPQYALMVFEGPASTDPLAERPWMLAIQTAKEAIGKNVKSQVLGEATFLCALDDGLVALSNLVAVAEANHIRLRTLFFESYPSFFVSGLKLN